MDYYAIIGHGRSAANERPVGKALAGGAEVQDEGPSWIDKLACAFSCWWAGSSYQACDKSDGNRVCICCNVERRPGLLWLYR